MTPSRSPSRPIPISISRSRRRPSRSCWVFPSTPTPRKAAGAASSRPTSAAQIDLMDQIGMFKGAAKPVTGPVDDHRHPRTDRERSSEILMPAGLEHRSDGRSSLTTRPPAIRAAGVDVAFQGPAGIHKVLAGLDVEVADGELLTIIGPSGCGKSTLLRIIADLLDPAAGAIEVFGQPPAVAPPPPRRRLRLPGFDAAALAHGDRESAPARRGRPGARGLERRDERAAPARPN